MRPAALALLGALAVSALALAQQPAIRDPQTFRTGIDVTGITVTVRDADGHLVPGLAQDAFTVFDDGEPQQITQFTSERVPVSLGVLLDISDSMFGKRIKDARAAVDRFLFDLLDPSDEFFVFAFNHRPRPLTGWTHAQDEVQRVLAAVQPSGGTAIYDTILESLPLMAKRSKQRAAILVISDGADTASTATNRDVRSALLRSDAFVYAIAIDSPERQAINTRVNVDTLRDLTAESGGRTEVVHNTADLSDATARIAEELNSQYVLGYYSSHPVDGRFHSIRVRATGYRVNARHGYVR